MKNFFYILASYLISSLFLWWFYDEFFRIKFQLPYLKYYEVVAIHIVFRFFFFEQMKNDYRLDGNFETLPMKDFFNKINKR
mgnify:CR=1 FL=1